MNYLSFKEFVNNYGLKNEATSNVRNKRNLKTHEHILWNIYER